MKLTNFQIDRLNENMKHADPAVFDLRCSRKYLSHFYDMLVVPDEVDLRVMQGPADLWEHPLKLGQTAVVSVARTISQVWDDLSNGAAFGAKLAEYIEHEIHEDLRLNRDLNVDFAGYSYGFWFPPLIRDEAIIARYAKHLWMKTVGGTT